MIEAAEGDGSGGTGIHPSLQPFCDREFDAKRFAQDFYRQRTDAQAKIFCASLMESEAIASQQLQQKVFRHYPLLISASEEMSEMESSLSGLRRSLGKTDFLLSSLENAALRVSSLQVSETISGARTGGHVDSFLSAGRGFNDSLDLSRLKKAQALLSQEDYPYKWVIEAPNKLDVLLHFDAFGAAVDLINDVRRFDIDGILEQDKEQDNYMGEERIWALRFAKGVIEEEAQRLGEELIGMLENNLSSSSRHAAASGTLSRKKMHVAPRRRASSFSADFLGSSQVKGEREDSKKESTRSKRRTSNHPALFLQSLGLKDAACTAFLLGKKRFLKQLADEITFSPLATEPEQCIIELAQTVFRGILDTHLDFRLLFKSDGSNLVAVDDQNATPKINPDAMLSCLTVWTKEQASRFIADFVRFLLPGCVMLDDQAGIVSSTDGLEESHQKGALAVTAQNVSAPQETLFDFEQGKGQDSFVLLSNDEWRVLGNCLRWTLLLCRRLEKEGISLNFVVARQLKAPLNVALEAIFVQVERKARYALGTEAWKSEQLRVESRDKSGDAMMLSLTSSGQKMYELVHDLIRKVKRIYSTNYSTTTASLEAKIISRVISILETYLVNIIHLGGFWPVTLDDSREAFEDFVLAALRRGDAAKACREKLLKLKKGCPLDEKESRVVTVLMDTGRHSVVDQMLGKISDILFVSTDLIVRVRENFEKLFRRRIGPLRDLEEQCGNIENTEAPLRMICDSFVTRNSAHLLEDVLRWSHFDYSSEKIQRTASTTSNSTSVGDLASPDVSPNFVRLAAAISELKTVTCKRLGNHACALDLIGSIVEHVLLKLNADGAPSAIFGPVQGPRNQKRLAADLHMLLETHMTLLEREASDSAKELVMDTLKKLAP